MHENKKMLHQKGSNPIVYYTAGTKDRIITRKSWSQMAILTSSWKCRPNEQHNCLPFRGENVPWESDHYILNVNAHFVVAVSPRHTGIL